MTPERAAERKSLEADLAALMRMIYRLRPEAQHNRIWTHLEAAALDLKEGQRALQRNGHERD